jgi:hypothetical protein
MKQTEMRIGKHYRTDTGARVKIIRTGVAGFSGRRDSVRVRYVGGSRDGEEAKLPSRSITREWSAKDEQGAETRTALNKKVGAARVRLAILGFEEATVMPRGDGTIGLRFHGEAAERVLEILIRALEEDAA